MHVEARGEGRCPRLTPGTSTQHCRLRPDAECGKRACSRARPYLTLARPYLTLTLSVARWPCSRARPYLTRHVSQSRDGAGPLWMKTRSPCAAAESLLCLDLSHIFIK